MATNIVIEIGGKTLRASLGDTAAAKRVAAALPLTVTMSRWGDEYYGSAGLSIPEDASTRELMEVGEIAYWGPGKALCIFFGPTPASTDERPRAASDVLPIGKVIEGIGELGGLGSRVKAVFRSA